MNQYFTDEQCHDMTMRVLALEPHTRFLCFRGSVAHGTYVPSSDPNSIDDVDLIGFVIPGSEHYFGLHEWGSHGTREIKEGELDVVLYEWRKFVGLLAKGNPNVLSTLFVEAPNILLIGSEAAELRRSRNLFLSRDLYHPFIGYAHGQLKRMQSPHFEGYMGEKRKALVERFGYDVKNGAHCLRILRLGYELLSTGAMTVDRTDLDARELIGIKHGEWTVQRVLEEAEAMMAACRRAKEASELPEHVDLERIDGMCVRVLRDLFGSC